MNSFGGWSLLDLVCAIHCVYECRSNVMVRAGMMLDLFVLTGVFIMARQHVSCVLNCACIGHVQTGLSRKLLAREKLQVESMHGHGATHLWIPVCIRTHSCRCCMVLKE